MLAVDVTHNQIKINHENEIFFILQTIIKEMNRIGMFVDLSHVSWQTMEDAFEIATAPVIFSHSSAWHLCNHNRNVRDNMLNKTVSKIIFYI